MNDIFNTALSLLILHMPYPSWTRVHLHSSLNYSLHYNFPPLFFSLLPFNCQDEFEEWMKEFPHLSLISISCTDTQTAGLCSFELLHMWH